MSSMSSGTLLGSFLLGRVNISPNIKNLYRGWAIYGAIMSIAFLIAKPNLLLLWTFGLGISGAVIDILMPTIIQKTSSESNIGQNFSYFSTFANLGEAMSSIMVGGLLLAMNPEIALTTCGTLVIVISSVALFRYKITLNRA